MGEKQSFNRRHVLLSSSVLATGSTAGCLGFGGGGGGSDDSGDNDEDEYGGGSDDSTSGSRTVEVVSNAFEPQLLQVDSGETVQFTCTEGSHTVTLYHPSNDDKPLRAPETADSFDSGTIEEGETFEITPETEGVYDYFCKPHEGSGMVGSLIVGDNDDPDQAGLSEPADIADGAAGEIERLNRAARAIFGLEANDQGGDGVQEIAIVSNRFYPRLSQVSPGDTLRFSCAEGSHTATLYHPDNDDKPRRAPEDAAAWDSGTLEAGETFETTVETPGVYDYFCRPHEGQGMVGSVIVGDNDDPDQAGLSTPEDVPTGAADALSELNAVARSVLEVGDQSDDGADDGDDNGSTDPGVTEVSIVSNSFDPELTQIEPGESIKFTCEEGTHTATAYHTRNDKQLRAPAGGDPWHSGTLNPGDSFTVQFDTAGVFDYYCQPHEEQGMVGSIIVGDNDDPLQGGLSEPRDVPRAAETGLSELNDQAREQLGIDDEAAGTVVQVNVVSNEFRPRLQSLSPGDTVRFNVQEGEHTATLYHPDNDVTRRAPTGAGVWDSGTLQEGESFEVTIETPGVYDYFCRPHEGQGMVGSLIVGDNDNPDQPGLSTPEDVPDGAVTALANLNSRARDQLGIDDFGGGNNDDGTASDSRLEIAVNSTFFNPAVDTVEAGGTVEFTVNEGTHTATLYHPDNGDLPLRAPENVDAWDSGTIEAGDTFSVQLDEPGVYDYFCKFHRSLSMVGSIVVRGEGDDDPGQAGLSEPDDVEVQEAADRLRELNDEARELLGL